MSTGNISDFGSSTSAPLVNWHEHDKCSHVLQLYSSHKFLADTVSRFVATALASGGAGVVVATAEHEAAIREKLQTSGFDVTSTRCTFLNAADTLGHFFINGTHDRDRFQRVLGSAIERARQAAGTGGQIAVYGEMVAQLWAEGKTRAAVELEQLWNELGKIHSFSLRCAYPLQFFDEERHAEQFLQICRAHTAVIPDETYSELNSEGERLRHISYLQQRARALEKEKLERKQAQTSLRLREAELADLLENALEGVQRVDADRRISWANPALLHMLGYTAEEYAGRWFSDFWLKREEFEQFWRRIMARENVWDFAAELRCKNASIKYVLIHSNALWDGDALVHVRCFMRDITEQRKVEIALRDSEARLRKAKQELEQIVQQRTQALRRLSAQVLGLQDAERRRIARELHDSLGQYLAVLKLNIEMLRETPESEELWAESERLTDRCISEMRTLSYLLHPPMIDEAGLASAVRWYIDGFGQRSGTKVNLHVSDDFGRLPENMELALFRILQEGLTNVHRHAKASAVSVHITRENGWATLEIKDNGRGVAPEVLQRYRESGTGTGVGLTGVRERVRELNGQLTLESNSTGTWLQVTVPIPKRARIEHISPSSPAAAD